MGRPSPPYPLDLRKAIDHAERLSEVLEGLEQSARAGSWLIGRSAELRTVVSCAVSDWRADGDAGRARHSITVYMDGLHRRVARRLGRARIALDCCAADEAITSEGDAPSGALLSALSVITATGRDHGPTQRDVWVEPPEVVDRFLTELENVDRAARALFRGLGGHGITLDDLRAFGREGLLDAARSYPDRHAVPFGAWAAVRIRSAIIDGIRRWGGIPRRALALQRNADAESTPKSAVRNGDVLHSVPADEDPESLLARAEDRRLVQALVERLPARERLIVQAYFFEGKTLEQAASCAGLTKSGASVALKRGLQIVGREVQRSRAEAGG